MQSLETLTNTRNNLQKAYDDLSQTSITQYSIQGRQVLYEQRENILTQIQRIERKMALADPDINATGFTKIDLLQYRWRQDIGE
jgi:hypothetical protein|tara:strand:- start:3762 stop:4013 length:252 start_codon:yes stop_codon:yes gene_type:complete